MTNLLFSTSYALYLLYLVYSLLFLDSENFKLLYRFIGFILNYTLTSSSFPLVTLTTDLPRLKVATRCLVEFNTLYLVYNNNFLILSCYTALCHFLCSKYRVTAYYLYICLFFY